MTQIKFFRICPFEENMIEDSVNSFLQEHADDEIISVQYQALEDLPGYTVMVTYRTK